MIWVTISEMRTFHYMLVENYNFRQKTDQYGIHAFWESRIPDYSRMKNMTIWLERRIMYRMLEHLFGKR